MKRSRRDSEAKSTAVVTTGRIERKRAHDREAQRASRAKTKAYIAHLEKTVADLTETSGDARANYLAQHATQQSQEIESLQGLVGKIKSLIQDASVLTRTEGDDNSRDSNTASKHDHTSAETSPQTNRRGDSPHDTSSPETIIRDDGDRHQHSNSGGNNNNASSSTSSYNAPTVAYPATPSPHGNLTLLGESLLCSEDDDTTYFDRLNRVLEQVEAHPSATTGHISNPTTDQDILIRAILYGWDAAERLHHFDIVWRFLRAFDEGLWYRAGPLERIAHHWLFRNVLLHKMRPTNQPLRPIPQFMRPTPHQRRTPGHHSLADYYVWPKVRDLIIDRGGLEITGRTSIAFVNAVRWDWPFEFRDAFHRVRGAAAAPGGGDNGESGTFQLSGEFMKRFHWLSNYRIERPIEQLPLLEQLIPLHPAQTCGAVMAAAATEHDSLAAAGPPGGPASNLSSLLAWHDFRNEDVEAGGRQAQPSHPLGNNHEDDFATTTTTTTAASTAPQPTHYFAAPSASTITSTQDLYATISALEEPHDASTLDDPEDFAGTFPLPGAAGGPAWAPSCSVDAASEAAFMEFAMDMWPSLS